MQARIEKTTLGEIAQRIEETYSNERCFLAVHLDLDLLEKLHLEVTAHRYCMLPLPFVPGGPC